MNKVGWRLRSGTADAVKMGLSLRRRNRIGLVYMIDLVNTRLLECKRFYAAPDESRTASLPGITERCRVVFFPSHE